MSGRPGTASVDQFFDIGKMVDRARAERARDLARLCRDWLPAREWVVVAAVLAAFAVLAWVHAA